MAYKTKTLSKIGAGLITGMQNVFQIVAGRNKTPPAIRTNNLDKMVRLVNEELKCLLAEYWIDDTAISARFSSIDEMSLRYIFTGEFENFLIDSSIQSGDVLINAAVTDEGRIAIERLALKTKSSYLPNESREEKIKKYIENNYRGTNICDASRTGYALISNGDDITYLKFTFSQEAIQEIKNKKLFIDKVSWRIEEPEEVFSCTLPSTRQIIGEKRIRIDLYDKFDGLFASARNEVGVTIKGSTKTSRRRSRIRSISARTPITVSENQLTLEIGCVYELGVSLFRSRPYTRTIRITYSIANKNKLIYRDGSAIIA
ncbi:hypothetical protein FACS1894109_02490 [Spirochaetia bacterium]|nr:hypothetical protein FACS1894109_02490 [Spirochaetia bacterium]